MLKDVHSVNCSNKELNDCACFAYQPIFDISITFIVRLSVRIISIHRKILQYENWCASLSHTHSLHGEFCEMVYFRFWLENHVSYHKNIWKFHSVRVCVWVLFNNQIIIYQRKLMHIMGFVALFMMTNREAFLRGTYTHNIHMY